MSNMNTTGCTDESSDDSITIPENIKYSFNSYLFNTYAKEGNDDTFKPQIRKLKRKHYNNKQKRNSKIL